MLSFNLLTSHTHVIAHITETKEIRHTVPTRVWWSLHFHMKHASRHVQQVSFWQWDGNIEGICTLIGLTDIKICKITLILRVDATLELKPHSGASGVPFMNSRIGCAASSDWMRSVRLGFGRAVAVDPEMAAVLICKPILAVSSGGFAPSIRSTTAPFWWTQCANRNLEEYGCWWEKLT